MTDRIDNRTLGDLIAELSKETGQLVRKEIELASTELTAKAKNAGARIGVAAAGGALIHAGFLVLLATLVIALTEFGLAAWLAALLVGVFTLVVGYVMLNRGLSGLRAMRMTPHHTMESLKEDAQWAKRQGA